MINPKLESKILKRLVFVVGRIVRRVVIIRINVVEQITKPDIIFFIVMTRCNSLAMKQTVGK